MNLKAFFTASFFLKSIFVVSLFILIFISAISYKHSSALTNSTELLVRSYNLRIELEQLISWLKDAENGQRGYIISHDPVFLEPFNSARSKINVSFNTLKILTKESHQQQTNLDSLNQLVRLRFNYLDSALKQDSINPLDTYLLDRNLFRGKLIMDKIRAQINKMIDLEKVSLKDEQKKYDYEISFTPVFTLVLLMFSLLVFIFSYYKINRDFEVLQEANENLIISSESIKQAEKIGSFSSWQWNLDSNKFIVSDNQYRLLGAESQSFEPSMKKFLEFVHPKDRQIIIDGREHVMNGNEPSTVFYRIIRADGELRYFKTIGKLLTDVRGKKILIGINWDVTEQHLSSLALEERNRELEQMNSELASFNHIASHDLQAPLRKIQTFISRISDHEVSTLSEISQEYFSKIQNAASQMRLLIDDLLLFSRANRTEKVFEKTDLNILLENARQELAQSIEEKKAVILSAKLPELNVIPFQIQQLFINLLGNSLKYSKPDITPLIKIDSEKIVARDYPVLKSFPSKTFYKISVTDNGLGFEQQYAENIFTLFYRLHQANQFPGTGIGLAICKKIIENHHGIITGYGQPEIGSTFTFYLPE